jgi:hypothetical protein
VVAAAHLSATRARAAADEDAAAGYSAKGAAIAMMDVVAESSAEDAFEDVMCYLGWWESPLRRCAHGGQAALLRLPFLGGA